MTLTFFAEWLFALGTLIAFAYLCWKVIDWIKSVNHE
jgi:hypothetical protein